MPKRYLFPAALLISFYISAQNNNGDSLFNAPVIHNVYLNIQQAGYWDSLTANYTADVYMKCDVVFDGRALAQTGIKFKGNSSYNNPSRKKSFKLDFNLYDSLQDYNDLKKLNLNNGFKDPSFLREKIMLDYCQRAGIPAPRCAFAKVYINNVYWGLYTVVEEIDNSFLKDRFFDKKGNLFKGDPQGDLKWLGSSVSNYQAKYELHSNQTQNIWTDLVHLIDKINNSTTAQFHDSLESVFNTVYWMRAWAGAAIFANLDSYIGSGHNYFIYHDSITNKFNWVTWDVNEAFGNFNMGMPVSTIENMSMYFVSSVANRPLCAKVLGNTAYKADLTNEFCRQVENYFSNAILDPVIDSLANVIRAAVYADTLKTYSNQNFEDNLAMDITVGGNPGGGSIAGLKAFITNRRNALVTELYNNGCTIGINENNFSPDVKIFPNPATETVFFSWAKQIKKIQIFSVEGKIILEMRNPAEKQMDVKGLAPGIYFIKIFSPENSGVTKKFIRE